MLERNHSIDLMRLFCAYGVIVTHIPAGTLLAKDFQLFFHNFHVPFFYLTALGLFSFKSNKNFKEVAKRMLQRLVVPYLIWTIIYVALLIYSGPILLSNVDFISLIKIAFYGESAVHLYFVPQLIFMQLLLFSILNILKRNNIISNMLLFLLSSIFFGFGQLYNCFGNTGFISLIFYLGFGYLVRNMILNSNSNYKGLSVGFILFFTVIFFTYNKVDNFIVNLPWGGLSLILICGGIKISKKIVSPLLLSMSYATFGIYLIHICFVEGIEIISEKIYGSLKNDLFQNILYSIMVLFFSYWTCLIVNKLNVTRYLLLGNGSKK